MILDGNSAVKRITETVDEFFKENYSDFVRGSNLSHPILPPKQSKIIHDFIWGTNRFDWFEMAVIDSPILQRLRYLHQVGFGSYVYPSASHTRFDHSLGTSIVASKVFDNLLSRQKERLSQIVRSVYPTLEPEKSFEKLRQEVRLAALLHDSGHTMFSHSSESVHSEIKLLAKAREELSALAGKPRSTGEVLSFCISQSNFLHSLIENYEDKIPKLSKPIYSKFTADLDNVSLMIIGRSKHPYLQFMGDIISSGFDADKLDYLMRDGHSTGLPVNYDLDRYLQFVSVEESQIELLDSKSLESVKSLYDKEMKVGDTLEEYRLKIPHNAITSMEEVVIGKFMLYGYMYHHPKIRGMDSYFERVLREEINNRKRQGEKDEDLIKWMFSINDSVIVSLPFFKKLLNDSYSSDFQKCAYRISTRTLPREVFGINGSAISHAPATMILDFLTQLQDPDKKGIILNDIETRLKGVINNKDAIFWIDVPNAPNFEDVKNIVGRKPFYNLFPVDKWMEAYMHYTYRVRVYTFSEYVEDVIVALRQVMPKILSVETKTMESLIRTRET
jgi:HD superfamily phosphohydrolase